MSFAEFYMNGGFYMNVLTLLGALTTGALVRGVIERRIAAARGTVIAAGPGPVPRLVAVIVLVGVLALVDGGMQIMEALRTVPMEQWPQAFVRGASIVAIPFGWALAIAATLLLADTLLARRPAAVREPTS